MEKKKFLIGLVVILFFILGYFGLNNLDDSVRNKKLHNYPDSNQILEDTLFRLEEFEYNGENISKSIDKKDIEIKDIKYDLKDENLDLKFKLIVSNSKFTMELKFDGYYNFRDDKWKHNGSVRDGDVVVYPTSCDSEDVLEFLKKKYDNKTKFDLKSNEIDKNKSCIFEYEIENNQVKDNVIVEKSIYSISGYQFEDKYELDVKSSEVKTFELMLNKQYKYENKKGGSIYTFMKNNKVESSAWAKDGGASSYKGTYEVDGNYLIITLTEMEDVTGEWTKLPEIETKYTITSQTAFEDSNGNQFKVE